MQVDCQNFFVYRLDGTCLLFQQLATSLQRSSCSKCDFHRLKKELDEANRLDVTTTRTKSARCTTWSNVEVIFKTFSNSPEQIKILQSFPWVGDLKLPCVRFDKASKIEPANTSFRGIFGHYGEKERRIFMLLFKKPNSTYLSTWTGPYAKYFS